jgi:hypothetical protein
MTYAPYEMNENSSDLRSADLKREQRAEFHDTMARARTLQTREKAERWSPERSWGERLPGAKRQWKCAEDLATYLASEWQYNNAKPPTPEQREKIDRTARAMWTSRMSEAVVPSGDAA